MTDKPSVVEALSAVMAEVQSVGKNYRVNAAEQIALLFVALVSRKKGDPMMAVQILDSPHRCPRCSKRMVMDVGQDDYTGHGDLTVRHDCIQCGYSEHGPANPEAARRRSPTVRSAAERLLSLRLGEVDRGVLVPLIYDPEPFPRGDFDAD